MEREIEDDRGGENPDGYGGGGTESDGMIEDERGSAQHG